MNDPSSALLHDSSLNLDPHFAPIKDTVIDCGNGTWSSSCHDSSIPPPSTAPPVEDDGKQVLNGGALAGIIIASVAFLGIVIIIARRVRRRRRARKAIEDPPAAMASSPVIYVQQSPIGVQPVLQPVGIGQPMIVGAQPGFPMMQANGSPVLQPVAVPYGLQQPSAMNYVAQPIPGPNQKPNQ
jgi:hypothetical protein